MIEWQVLWLDPGCCSVFGSTLLFMTIYRHLRITSSVKNPTKIFTIHIFRSNFTGIAAPLIEEHRDECWEIDYINPIAIRNVIPRRIQPIIYLNLFRLFTPSRWNNQKGHVKDRVHILEDKFYLWVDVAHKHISTYRVNSLKEFELMFVLCWLYFILRHWTWQ